MSNYKEELEQWKISKMLEDNNFREESLSAGRNNLSYNGLKQDGNIKTIIPDILDTYIEELEIVKGELIINTTDKVKIEASKMSNMPSNPYVIVDGELKSAGTNLELMSSDGTLTIPENVTKIGNGAFSSVVGLKNVIIPGSVKEIGENAFAYNETLEKVELQDGIETIGGKAFYKCANLKEISLPNTILQVGAFCLSGTKIKEFQIPTGMKEISTGAFYGLSYLLSVNIPEGVETIKAEAFSSCTNLSSITIPSTVNTIDPRAFGDCANLIYINLCSEKFTYEAGMLFPKDKGNIIFISQKFLENTDTLNIPEGVTNLGLLAKKHRKRNGCRWKYKVLC